MFYNQHDDVVLIPIGVIVNGKQYEFPDAEPLGLSKGFVSSWNALIINVLAPYNNIRIGTDVLIVGYPSSIGLLNKPQYDYYKPLLRKGIVAGVYPHQRTFIIDSPVFGGNSGGPVLQKSNGKRQLLGLITEYIPYVSGKDNLDLDNSGYSIAVSSEVIMELATSMHEKLEKYNYEIK